MTEFRDRTLAAARPVAEACDECGVCLKECRLLAEEGAPRALALEEIDGTLPHEVAFACALCGLCTAVCPQGCDPRAMFQARREEALQSGRVDVKAYKPLLNYEKMGLSEKFRLVAPGTSGTVFFPGCSLPGARPETALRTFEALRRIDPGMGVVLECCLRSSKALGRRAFWEEHFGRMCARLEAAGVREVLTACPSCLMVLDEAKTPFSVRTVYEVLAEAAGDAPAHQGERHRVGVHDPCSARFFPEVHQAVRRLLRNSGYSVAEMRHAHHKALCCGEGGGLPFADPELADHWRDTRIAEARQRDIATYCSGGCLTRLGPEKPTAHVLDCILSPGRLPDAPPARSPRTYVNRLLFKRKVKRFFS